jgi:hypothetical protein
MNLEKQRIPIERDRQIDTERAGEIVFLHLGSAMCRQAVQEVSPELEFGA